MVAVQNAPSPGLVALSDEKRVAAPASAWGDRRPRRHAAADARRNLGRSRWEDGFEHKQERRSARKAHKQDLLPGQRRRQAP